MISEQVEPKPWRPRTSYVRDDLFIWKGITYRVLEAFITGLFFDENDSRYVSVTDATTGRGIANIVVNEDGDLIITYTDGSMTNAGRVNDPTVVNHTIVERLVVSTTNVLSQPNNQIDTSKPAVLFINHLAYHSVEVPPPFTMTADTITWDENQGGFDLTVSDTVVFQYTRVAP